MRLWIWPAFLCLKTVKNPGKHLCASSQISANLSPLCLKHISVYLTLNNVKLPYLSNNCLPALRLTHQLPPWPDVHPKCLWSAPTTEDSEITLGMQMHAGAQHLWEILPSILELSKAGCDLCKSHGIILYFFFSGASGTNQWSNVTNLQAEKYYSVFLSQIRIWLHIITIWQK